MLYKSSMLSLFLEVLSLEDAARLIALRGKLIAEKCEAEARIVFSFRFLRAKPNPRDTSVY